MSDLCSGQSGLADIADKVTRGERLSAEDGLHLMRSPHLAAIGALANLARERLHGNRAYFIVNRHINYTNICVNRCRFCAFSRSPGEDGAYTLPVEECLEKARAFRGGRVSEFHIVGGCHPDLQLSYYIELLSALKAEFPEVHLQAFTAVEIAHIAALSGLSVRECLTRLQEAGLGSLPGGGAEVFSSRVREALCPRKLPAEEWLAVMREAHSLGIRSNCTMLYGHIERPEEVVAHLLRLRALQDETGGFLAFIPLAFHPANTALAGQLAGPTAFDDLRMIAVSRLLLDNVPHIKVFWIMVEPKVAQIALSFGADDMDGTVAEERITHAAGAQTPEALTISEIKRLIEGAGREPVERDTLYQPARLSGASGARPLAEAR
jgi:aminodeoxyfutalosine synthase